MPQHKAPTAVTIAPTTDKSGFSQWVEKYWKLGAGILLVVIAWIIYQSRAESEQVARSEEGWSKLLGAATPDPTTSALTGSPEELKRVAAEIERTPAGPWALYLAATSAVASKDFDRAGSVLA